MSEPEVGGTGDRGEGRDHEFLRHRPLILRLAYDINGSWTDAEDIAQSAYERWAGARDVDHPKAYLARVAVNLALDLVRSPRRQDYPGTYLPEPMPADPEGDGVAVVERAAEVERALLLVLESLTPLQRAVVILGDVFGYRHAEIATMLDTTPEAVRQQARRARAAVEARRPRREPTPAEVAAVVERFLDAARGGDLARLIGLLAPDVELISDGGGLIRAARVPVQGRNRVARFVLGVLGHTERDITVEPATLSGRPGIVIHVNGRLDTAGWVELGTAGITRFCLVRNPAKLRWLAGG